MSIWGDVQRRGMGVTSKQEDTHLIYNGECEVVKLDEGEYRDKTYKIYTNGQYPSVKIFTENRISYFSGMQIVRLKSETGETYNLERARSSKDNLTVFTYYFNTKKDYICDFNDADRDIQLENSQPGHKYTLGELRKYAEMFINLIIKCDDDLSKYLD